MSEPRTLEQIAKDLSEKHGLPYPHVVEDILLNLQAVYALGEQAAVRRFAEKLERIVSAEEDRAANDQTKTTCSEDYWLEEGWQHACSYVRKAVADLLASPRDTGA